MSSNKTYWRGLDEKAQTPEFIEKASKEFQEDLPVEEFIGSEEVSDFKTGRRDFLKFLGFGVAAATLASCEAPVIKSIPYINKPEDITPGVANWYASTFFDGNDFANVLVKSREGRPIWIKGNAGSGYSGVGLTPRVNASILNLYNSERLQDPFINEAQTTWGDVDKVVASNLRKVASEGGKIRLMTSTLASPSTELAISEFIKNIGGDFEWVKYDAISYSAIREANKMNFGEAIIPDYYFEKADTIVSIAADFMSNWLMPTKFRTGYGLKRKPENGQISRFFQFESIMSLSGANADYRTMVKPSENGAVAAAILKHVGGEDLGITVSEKIDAAAKKAAESLLNSKGKSIVIAGANDVSVQVVVNAINEKLGNYGKTIDLDAPLNIKQADDKKVEELVNDVVGGKVKALLLYNVNPVYTLPNGKEFGEAIRNIDLSVSFSEFADETATKCNIMTPNHNYLESWNDYSIKEGYYAMQQPLIRPLYNTRQAQESMLVWAGVAERSDRESTSYYQFMRDAWEKYGFPTQSEHNSFDDYWNWTVHNGVDAPYTPEPKGLRYSSKTSSVKGGLTKESGDFEVVMYATGELGEGQYAANPWLQELPNAITKVTWDNYVTMSVFDACKVLGIENDTENPINTYNKLHIAQEEKAFVVNVTVGEEKVKLPIYPQPGQAHGTIGIALGYGRGIDGERIGKAAYQVELENTKGEYILEGGKKVPIGANSYKFTSLTKGLLSYSAIATVSNADEKYALACTQTHHTIMGRDSILKETDMATFSKALESGDHSAYNHAHELHITSEGGGQHIPIADADLWDKFPVELVGHRWVKIVDLSACDGCGVCIIACHTENNVPVVGKDEVRRSRDMHWLRLDRYFSSVDSDKRQAWNKDKTNAENGDWTYANLEVPEDSPSVMFMPMMCQHCNHAPCETVCPVAATTHSNEGLNMMAYNRCIGTRYCANNCPYKVRRFNWFNYRDYRKFSKVNIAQDEMARMVLNPDVVVRSRGVMEKCSFCVQRIQAGKLTAKSEGRTVVDGDVVAACADACPTDCISFGDWNDVESNVRFKSSEGRTYQALEEVGTQPNVYYQAKVRNIDVEEVAHASEDSHETGGH